jgi:hyaluronoglucosaminidase
MSRAGGTLVRSRAPVWILVGLGIFLVGFRHSERFPTIANDFATSGVIEGFFGPVYSFEARRHLFEFTARAGLNTYIYAPKNDPFHRDRWRDPYPPEHLAHFQDMAALGADIGVRFVFAIAPGLSYDPQSNDIDLLTDKLTSLFNVGVRDFCVLFDDVFGSTTGPDPDLQADVVTAVFAFLQALDPDTSLCFISHFYEGTVEQLQTDSSRLAILYPQWSSSAAYAVYERIPPEVAIMWTGPAVFTDRLTVVDASAFRSFVERPVIVWDNYPVNDSLLANELFLGPYQGREAGIDAVLDGIVVNPMQQPEATKIPLWTVGRALGLAGGYDPWVAWSEALMVAANGGKAAVRTLERLASHFQSHPLIGENPESPELAVAVEKFLDTRSRRHRAVLRRLFRRYAKNHRRLERRLAPSRPRPHSNPALFAEIESASEKLALLGEAGGLALDLLRRAEAGEEVDVTPLEDTLAAASAIPWRVGVNLVPDAIAPLLADKFPPNNQDVFQGFFDRILAELVGTLRAHDHLD